MEEYYKTRIFSLNKLLKIKEIKLKHREKQLKKLNDQLNYNKTITMERFPMTKLW